MQAQAPTDQDLSRLAGAARRTAKKAQSANRAAARAAAQFEAALNARGIGFKIDDTATAREGEGEDS